MSQTAIQVEQGADSGRVFAFSGSGVRIGTAPDCEVRLSDESVPAHAVSVINMGGQFTVYPADSSDTKIGNAEIESDGTVWKPGDLLSIGNSRMRLGTLQKREKRPAAPVAAPRDTQQKIVEQAEPAAVAAPEGTKSDTLRYVLIAVILAAAVGIVLLPESSTQSDNPKQLVAIGTLFEELSIAGKKPDSRRPTLHQIHEQMLLAYRSEANPGIARPYYATALQMLLMRTGKLSATPTVTSNSQSREPPLQFETPLEANLYFYLIDKLASPGN